MVEYAFRICHTCQLASDGIIYRVILIRRYKNNVLDFYNHGIDGNFTHTKYQGTQKDVPRL